MDGRIGGRKDLGARPKARTAEKEKEIAATLSVERTPGSKLAEELRRAGIGVCFRGKQCSGARFTL